MVMHSDVAAELALPWHDATPVYAVVDGVREMVSPTDALVYNGGGRQPPVRRLVVKGTRIRREEGGARAGRKAICHRRHCEEQQPRPEWDSAARRDRSSPTWRSRDDASGCELSAREACKQYRQCAGKMPRPRSARLHTSNAGLRLRGNRPSTKGTPSERRPLTRRECEEASDRVPACKKEGAEEALPTSNTLSSGLPKLLERKERKERKMPGWTSRSKKLMRCSKSSRHSISPIADRDVEVFEKPLDLKLHGCSSVRGCDIRR